MEEVLEKGFEAEVRDFLKKLRFDSINGGDSFFLRAKGYSERGIQIDAIARHEDTVIVIECITKQELGRSYTLNNQIFEFAGKSKPIIEALKEGRDYPEYGDCLEYRFVLITKNIEVSDESKRNAEKWKIILWDDSVIEYYKELYDILDYYAKYSMLGELKIKPKVQEYFGMPAFKIMWEKYPIYILFCNPKEILPISYVARREVGNEQFYQRIIKPDKIEKIAKYLTNKNGFFPNSIILSIKSKVTFTPLTTREEFSKPEWLEYGWLQFPKDYRSCWIIDGQHRLFGFSHIDTDKKIPVVAFDNLELTKQGEFFLTINKTQTPVDKELLWDLNGDMIPNEEDGIISNAIKELDEIPEGNIENRFPFHNIFHITSKGPKKKGQLKFSTICIACKRQRFAQRVLRNKIVNPLFDENYEVTQKNITKLLEIFFRIVDKQFGGHGIKNEFIYTDSGIPIIIGFLGRILSHLRSFPKDDDIKKYVSALKNFLVYRYDAEDYPDLRKQTTSFANQDALINSFIIGTAQYARDPGFSEGIEMHVFNEIKRLEHQLAKLIKVVLDSETSTHNWLERVPPKIIDDARRRMNMAGSKKLEEWITIGDESEILKNESTYRFFKEIFECKYGFNNQEEFLMALRHLSNYRGKFEAHMHTDISIKYKEDIIMETEIDKISKCLKNLPKEMASIFEEEVQEDEE